MSDALLLSFWGQCPQTEPHAYILELAFTAQTKPKPQRGLLSRIICRRKIAFI